MEEGGIKKAERGRMWEFKLSEGEGGEGGGKKRGEGMRGGRAWREDGGMEEGGWKKPDELI